MCFKYLCQFLAQSQKKFNVQEIFSILKIKVFRNDNFHAGQVVKKNYVVDTLTLLQNYIKMLSTSEKKPKMYVVFMKKILKIKKF